MTSSKTCKGCDKIKPLTEFYRHPRMADGRLNYCKMCKRKDQKTYSKTDAGKATERKRNSKPQRSLQLQQRAKQWAKDNPEKRIAQHAANNALRDGRLERKEFCEDCGADGLLHKHHDDYDKPLEVTWLCPSCHGKRLPHYIGS